MHYLNSPSIHLVNKWATEIDKGNNYGGYGIFRS